MVKYRAERGDYVRATVEGRVISRSANCISIQTASRMAYLDPDLATWERLADPEPDWEPRDVVLDAVGVVWQRVEPGELKGWRSPGARDRYPDDYPERPLTLIARDGKPVKES